MKLLFCKKCGDIFNLSEKKVKWCSCGECCGKYEDRLHAWWSGDGIPFGLDNREFVMAAKGFMIGNKENTSFKAFIITDCERYKKRGH